MQVSSDSLSVQSKANYSTPLALDNSVALARQLMHMGALTAQTGGLLHTAGIADCGDRQTLLTAGVMIERLKAAREAATLLDHPLSLIACTGASTATAVENDADACDRKFLTGLKTFEQSHVYCGGLDAAIARALIFARYADVVCFQSQNTDLSEAAQFAAEVWSAFPDKRLGFGYAPSPDAVRWNELDHRAFDTRLRMIGYDFYFLSQFGRLTFLTPPAAGEWVLFGDVAASAKIFPSSLRARTEENRGFPSGALRLVSQAVMVDTPRRSRSRHRSLGKDLGEMER